MKIFNGKKISETILREIKEDIEREKMSPKLAVVSIDPNSQSKLYIRLKKEAASRVGINIVYYNFSKRSKEQKVIEKIKGLNNNHLIDGIIVQLPVPKNFNRDRIISSINPRKDVDGFHRENRELLKTGSPYFFPVLPSVIFLSLRDACPKFVRDKKGQFKNIIALVSSDTFGSTLKYFFKGKKLDLNYFVWRKYPLSQINKIIGKADILISVLGYPKIIKGDIIKKGVILIDAGISYLEGKVVGDVDRESVKNRASFLTPVPGGVGPVTVALLLRNVFLAAEKRYGYRR